jgi:hypothetical protein
MSETSEPFLAGPASGLSGPPVMKAAPYAKLRLALVLTALTLIATPPTSFGTSHHPAASMTLTGRWDGETSTGQRFIWTIEENGRYESIYRESGKEVRRGGLISVDRDGTIRWRGDGGQRGTLVQNDSGSGQPAFHGTVAGTKTTFRITRSAHSRAAETVPKQPAQKTEETDSVLTQRVAGDWLVWPEDAPHRRTSFRVITIDGVILIKLPECSGAGTVTAAGASYRWYCENGSLGETDLLFHSERTFQGKSRRLGGVPTEFRGEKAGDTRSTTGTDPLIARRNKSELAIQTSSHAAIFIATSSTHKDRTIWVNRAPSTGRCTDLEQRFDVGLLRFYELFSIELKFPLPIRVLPNVFWETITKTALEHVEIACPELQDPTRPVRLAFELYAAPYNVQAQLIRERGHWQTTITNRWDEERSKKEQQLADDTLRRQEEARRQAAARAQTEQRKVAALRELQSTLLRHGARRLVTCPELQTNPFAFEGQTIGIVTAFDRMLERDKAFFGCEVVASDVPSGTFGVNRSSVLLMGRVLGKTDIRGLFGPLSVPHIRFVGVHVCQKNSCSEFWPE